MRSPTLKRIDEIRKEGFRPGVVGCFVHKGKILLLFSREYKLWLLPQGGIGNKEKPEDALVREMKEELGEAFVDAWGNSKPILVLEDRIEFAKHKHADRALETDSGEEIEMVGKHYLYYVLEVPTDVVDVDEGAFDDYAWVEEKPARFLAERVYQKNKSKALQALLDELVKKKLII